MMNKGRKIRKIKALEVCSDVRDGEKKSTLAELLKSQQVLNELLESKQNLEKALSKIESEIDAGQSQDVLSGAAVMQYKLAYLDQLHSERVELNEKLKNQEKESKKLEGEFKLANARHEIVKKKHDQEKQEFVSEFVLESKECI